MKKEGVHFNSLRFSTVEPTVESHYFASRILWVGPSGDPHSFSFYVDEDDKEQSPGKQIATLKMRDIFFNFQMPVNEATENDGFTMFDTCENKSRWYCRTVPSWHVHGSLHSRFAWDTQPVHGLHSLKCSLSGVFMPLKSSFGECACGPTRFLTRPTLDEPINNMPFFFLFFFFGQKEKFSLKQKQQAFICP